MIDDERLRNYWESGIGNYVFLVTTQNIRRLISQNIEHKNKGVEFKK